MIRLVLTLLVGLSAGCLPAPLRYGVHTLRVDDRPLRLAADGGFDTVVQLLSWREIEPSRGDFFWEYPDRVVRAAAYYRLGVVFRIDQQPAWARPGTVNAPPSDVELYAGFVERVAARYRGRVAGYVIWNEPNLAVEWGNDSPEPSGYARLLTAAAAGIRAADPAALVIAAGLAPTNEESARAIDDRRFLREQLAAPGGRDFDVLGVHAYGFGRPPGERSPDGLDFQRITASRAILVDAGLDRPVWITEAGWTIDPSATVGGPAVREIDRARFFREAFAIAAGWRWVELMAVWNLAGDEPDFDGQSGFRLADRDYQPTASWRSLAAMSKFAGTPLGRLLIRQ